MRNLVWLVVSAIVIWMDQVTKLWASRHLAEFDALTIFNGFDLTLAHNYGAAFSLFNDGSGWQRYFFVVVAIVMSALLLTWLWGVVRQQRLTSFSIALGLGGAWGNLIDRLQHGYVVDFISFYYRDWHFPTFNVADMAICLGAGLLILISFKEEQAK